MKDEVCLAKGEISVFIYLAIDGMSGSQYITLFDIEEPAFVYA